MLQEAQAGFHPFREVQYQRQALLQFFDVYGFRPIHAFTWLDPGSVLLFVPFILAK